MLKVVHLYSSWTAGGAEKLMISLAASLEKRSVRNIIACPGDSYLFSKAKEAGLTAYPVVFKGSFDPFGLAALRAVIAQERPDVLHAHQGKVFWPCILAKWLSQGKIKVVFHRHAQLPHRFYSRGHYRSADRVIAISDAVACGLTEGERVPKGKIRTIYNGTDFERFNTLVGGEEVRSKYALGAAPVIGTVAAMNRPRGKGQEYLVEAAQIVKKEFPEARFLVVGTGPIEENLKALGRKLGVEKEVIFTGYQEEVEKYIAAMDIFTFLSWDTEGFGQVMVEAQAMGKPVVGTAIGGIPETFRNNESGILIRPRDSEMLAQVLIELLRDPRRRMEMGYAAVTYVHERFTMAMMTENVMKVYAEILPEKA